MCISMYLNNLVFSVPISNVTETFCSAFNFDSACLDYFIYKIDYNTL